MRKLCIALIAMALSTTAFANGNGGGSKAKAGSVSGSFVNAHLDASDNSKYDAPDMSERNPDVTVIAPGTTNQCVFSIGVGGSALGFGGAVTGTYEDKKCSLRAAAEAELRADPNDPVQQEVAKEIRCGDPAVYAARERLAKRTGNAAVACLAREDSELVNEAAVINKTRPTKPESTRQTQQEREDEWREGLG